MKRQYLSQTVSAMLVALGVSGCIDTAPIIENEKEPAPVITVLASPASLISNASPSITFTSNVDATLTWQGSCNSADTAITAGTNTVTLQPLANGLYDDCVMLVQSAVLQGTSELTLPPFTIDQSLANAFIGQWIGENDTQVTFPAALNGFEFYHSSDLNCDIGTDSASCNMLDIDTITGADITTAHLSLDQPAQYMLRDTRGQSRPITLNSESAPDMRFSERHDHQMIVFNNKLWVIGGIDNNITFLNDVWSSTDGIDWVEETSEAAFSKRAGHDVIVFDSKLWLVGGIGDDRMPLNDVWSSTDGISWNLESVSANFSPRIGHQLAVFNSELWLIGGGVTNEVWSTTDGINWVERTSPEVFSPRDNHQVVVFNNRLWVIGGRTDMSEQNDVWFSTNGINWGRATDSAEFTARARHQILKFDNELWLVGGEFLNDVWFSSDGVTWLEKTPAAAFSKRIGHKASVFNNRLLITGGFELPVPPAPSDTPPPPLFPEAHNDVWSSGNGVDWQKGQRVPIHFD
ncbi:Uncharacterised protein [BD1-7 clade bacterium]|uniref:DUF6242 domain-containing protein n=1 Tax=BD1-7 clade bacterium TaxID=2029982 RepID=A0A5S9P8F5_9GAMM|nr:Uncharacterised protein [BD1-7 clade bacterium]CAA0099704.1 Uncharacterised protein [BD1-7 clade bacterium]